MNNIVLSRLINNYITNLKLNNQFIDLIKQELKTKHFLSDINQSIYQSIFEYHYNDFLKKNNISQLNQKLQDTFKQRLIHKYSYSFAQEEINNNMKFSIGDKVNNLSFSSQKPEYRFAPIVVCREFTEDKTSYKDHVLIGEKDQHHEHVLNNNMNILENCVDDKGNESFTCLYLYPNNIVYISSRERHYYDINELIHILKTKSPIKINGIFYVNYPIKKNDDTYDETIKETTRLARRLF